MYGTFKTKRAFLEYYREYRKKHRARINRYNRKWMREYRKKPKVETKT